MNVSSQRQSLLPRQSCVYVACLTASATLGFGTPANGQTKDTRTLEEVIVTAQKRTERIENVPISISVMNGRDLDKFTGEGVAEALALVPGIKMTQDNRVGGPQLSIRGVSASGPFIEGSSPVAYYLDSVPFGFVKTAVVPDMNVYDLERIEVLRGPQGTLYGANALNGVVRILTHDADVDAFELKTRTSFATTEGGSESYRGDLVANMPVVRGKLGVRAAVGYANLGGWIDRPNTGDRDVNDAELTNVRLKVNAQPTDQLSLGLSAWHSRSDYDSAAVSDDHDEFPGTLRQPMSSDYDAFGFKLGYDSQALSISSMTSYIDYTSDTDVDYSPFNLGVFFTGLHSKVLSQEVIINSADQGAWRWSVGGFYRDAEDRLVQESDILLPAPIDFGDTSESFAAFGEITRALAEGKIEITGGLRYFEDDVAQIENAPFDGDTTRPLRRKQQTFSAVSPRVVLNWHPNDRTTLYSSYSEGFRSGYDQSAFAAALVPDQGPVKEDTLKNYEIGAKGSLFGGTLSYESAVYYIDWQDVQQTISVGPSSIVVAVNGKSASGMGVDFALSARPLDGLELGASVSWNDLTLDAPVISGGAVQFEKGDRLNYSSEYSAAVSAGYAFQFGQGLEARFLASANYSSSQTVRVVFGGNLLTAEGDDILIGRTSFSIGSPDRWTAALFVDNVNNERGVPFRGFAPIYSTHVRPRTAGLQLEFRF